jgi:glycosyltransferase involved in cell wall biosynthesis
MQDDSAIEIAYIVNGLPGLSESFIGNELRLLESMGLDLRIHSITHDQESIAHGIVSHIRAPVIYPRRGLRALMFSQLRLAVRRPRRYLSTLAHVIAMSWRYREGVMAPRKAFIKEFLQSSEIAVQILDAASVRHLHAHYCDATATVTWLVSLLTGLPFSFTAHTKDIYWPELNPGDLLRRKILAARFVTTCTAGDHGHLSQICPEYRQLHTVYPGLDVDYFTPQPMPGENRPPVILSVGRFVEKKGLEFLIAACAQLKAAGVSFCCWLVGPEGSHSERIQQTIETLDVSDVVSTNGAVTQEQLRQLYRRATVFVLPRLQLDDGDREGIPSVLAEAMAMGIPVVTTDIPGMSELIENGKNGLLVPQRDSHALTRVVQALLRSPELRRRLGQEGRRTVRGSFDSRHTTARLRDLFLTAVQSPASHPDAMPDPHPSMEVPR